MARALPQCARNELLYDLLATTGAWHPVMAATLRKQFTSSKFSGCIQGITVGQTARFERPQTPHAWHKSASSASILYVCVQARQFGCLRLNLQPTINCVSRRQGDGAPDTVEWRCSERVHMIRAWPPLIPWHPTRRHAR